MACPQGSPQQPLTAEGSHGEWRSCWQLAKFGEIPCHLSKGDILPETSYQREIAMPPPILGDQGNYLWLLPQDSGMGRHCPQWPFATWRIAPKIFVLDLVSCFILHLWPIISWQTEHLYYKCLQKWKQTCLKIIFCSQVKMDAVYFPFLCPLT